MKHPRILGPDGQPIDRAALTTEVAAPSITGIRSIWRGGAATYDLTPFRLAVILQRAATGDADAYLELAEEIEEKDLHYRSVLGTRKLAVEGVPITVEAASDAPEDQRLADEIRASLDDPIWHLQVYDLLDALAKGYSVAEMVWETSAKQWRVVQLHHRDPRWFTFDYTTGQGSGRTLLLRDDDAPLGKPLPPYTFLVHVPRLKTGIPIRQGLARVAAFAWMCKTYAVKDWVQFAEVFGMPLRLGRYDTTAQAEDLDVLRTAVAMLGVDASAILPESMQIDFIEAAKAGGGEAFFERMADWFDRQVSKAVLGQTSSADAVAGQLGGQEEKEAIRQDILQSDCNQLAATLNRDYIRPYIDINHGPRDAYPRIVIQVPDAEDLDLMSKVLERLVPMGLRVDQTIVRDKIGIPDPTPEAELLTAPASVPPPATNLTTAASNHYGTVKHGRGGEVCPGCGQAHDTALNRAGSPDPDGTDALAEESLGDWQRQMDPILDPVRRLAETSADAGEFKAGLVDVLARMGDTTLVQQLAAATLKARATGDASDDPMEPTP